ncbi:MAG: hypothetical protein ACRCS4_10495, partial [Flavobacterium sp.]
LLYTYYTHSIFILYPYTIHTLSIHYICSNKGQYIKYKKKYRTPFYDKRTSIVFMGGLEDY